MNKNIIESIENIDKWLNEVSKNNNHEIDQTKNLNMILLNLKIVCAGNKAVTPIADELAKIIKEMHDSTNILVTQGRKELREAFQNIKEYVGENGGDTP